MGLGYCCVLSFHPLQSSYQRRHHNDCHVFEAMASAGIWTAKLTPSLENISLNATTEVMDFCSLEFRKAEFPLILISTLLVNVLALIVLQRMRGTCDTLDHYLMSLLNLNDIITTGRHLHRVPNVCYQKSGACLAILRITLKKIPKTNVFDYFIMTVYCAHKTT